MVREFVNHTYKMTLATFRAVFHKIDNKLLDIRRKLPDILTVRVMRPSAKAKQSDGIIRTVYVRAYDSPFAPKGTQNDLYHSLTL